MRFDLVIGDCGAAQTAEIPRVLRMVQSTGTSSLYPIFLSEEQLFFGGSAPSRNRAAASAALPRWLWQVIVDIVVRNASVFTGFGQVSFSDRFP
jgi:hypothetical protein